MFYQENLQIGRVNRAELKRFKLEKILTLSLQQFYDIIFENGSTKCFSNNKLPTSNRKEKG